MKNIISLHFEKANVDIAVQHYPDKKRPALCLVRGNVHEVYAYFKNDEIANKFMNELAGLICGEKN